MIKGAHEQNGSKMSAAGKFLEKPRLQLDMEHELGREGGGEGSASCWWQEYRVSIYITSAAECGGV